MDKFQITLRVTSNERKMLMKRASRYGLTINGLIRFWINSESNSPRAFCKITCTACDGTGKIYGRDHCKKCQGMGFAYVEL